MFVAQGSVRAPAHTPACSWALPLFPAAHPGGFTQHTVPSAGAGTERVF